jgi:HlyD family secretion protein
LVQDAQAALSVDETNLRKASIRSPMQGVVLNRSVEPGNAVAASLQAVTLLTLAQDLKQLKLNVNIDEADVGKVREGQRATFTVASYPNRTYPAQVRRVAYGSTIKDNVVTYVAELVVSNEDLSLRPGMTATAVVTTDAREGVWRVPNAALRFAPDGLAAEESSGAREGGILSRLVPRMPAQAPRHATLQPGAFQRIWVLKDGRPQAIQVDAGPSDGRWTEVRGAGLIADLPVILHVTNGSAQTRS